jgi:23S rRNA U2552 (ribose-2'-O)-methylase RlmE/FtsJ
MDLVAILCLGFLFLGLMAASMKRGANRDGSLSVIENIITKWEKAPLRDWIKEYKGEMVNLSKTGFDTFKARGVRPIIKDELVTSRGFDKLKEIIRLTRVFPTGNVLSLCCGRGGWEQAYARLPGVTNIKAITFGPGPGHEGHEPFTNKEFPGRHKVNLLYGDAREYPKTDHDTLLFDGGESDTDPEKEVIRFNDLFRRAVMRQIYPGTKCFILKVLTPTDDETLKMLSEIQEITGKGAMYRVSSSRNSTLEVYFVSTPRANLSSRIKTILKTVMERARKGRKLAPRKIGPDYTYYRPQIVTKAVEVLQPLDMTAAIAELGPTVPEEGRNYNHWENKGVYPTGVEGSTGMKRNEYGLRCANRLLSNLPEFDDWKLTNTTPEGFVEVFNRKIDITPKEDHAHNEKMREVYLGLADHFRKMGYRHREMSYDDILKQANRSGAPCHIDVHQSVGDFLNTPDWRKEVERVRKGFLEGKPTKAIFNTMGKREKKKMSKIQGSRMIAYLPIPMRMLEMKVFGNLLKLTKPSLNRFGVGGLGLHDLGSRIEEVWKGFGVSNDIAGFDTRVGVVIQSLESMFIQELTDNVELKEIVGLMYRMYAYPHILIPIPSVFRRSELLAGRGQRMSGTNPTYSMNTITRLAIFCTEIVVGKNIPLSEIRREVTRIMAGSHGWGDIGGTISGDDATFTSKEQHVALLRNTGEVLEEIGFPRKNMAPSQKAEVAESIEEVDFCSHHYERISYYDSYSKRTVYKYAPTRGVAEIVAKSLIRVGGQDRELDSQAWLSAQGNNLLVNYPHLRTCRALGMAYKAVVNPNVVLSDRGGMIRPRPWMMTGDVLDVFNRVMFGDSTNYPIPDFRVREWGHVGYMKQAREQIYDPNCFKAARARWRDGLRRDVERAIYELSTGGNTDIMDGWRPRVLI